MSFATQPDTPINRSMEFVRSEEGGRGLVMVSVVLDGDTETNHECA